MNQPKHPERRWDRGSWVAFTFALCAFIYNLASGIVLWTTPTDGWLLESQTTAATAPQLIYRANIIGIPSDLREGDRVIAVNGTLLADLLRANHQFYRQQPPEWQDGHILQYQVIRDAQTLTLDVPIRRVGPIENLRAAFRSDILQSGGIVRMALQVLSSFSFFGIGCFVFVMRPRERAAHALLLLGVAFFFQFLIAVTSTPALFYPLASQTLSIFFNYWTCLIIPSLIYLMLAFPGAKFPLTRFPRATVVVLYAVWTVAYLLLYLFFPNDFAGFFGFAIPLSISGLPVLIPAVILFGISFRRERDLSMRAQYKWMSFGLFGFIGIGILGWFLGAFLTGGSAFAGYMATLGWLLLPISLVFAITRTRLFDIDIIIRKTLTYTLVVSFLLAIYFGCVILLQQVIAALTGLGQNEVITVLSTLAIAALFVPLRNRIQAFIDRRFYRKKYDAQQVLSDFAQTVRDETDLEKLTGRLIQVVEETMQPTSVSVWLKKGG
jgi:hypothetical protein